MLLPPRSGSGSPTPPANFASASRTTAEAQPWGSPRAAGAASPACASARPRWAASCARAGFPALLDAEEGVEVVGEAADGAEAVRLARRLLPDVVLMDIRMPGTDGLSATREITADASLAGVRVVVLTTFQLDEYVFEALRFGASGFLVKDIEPAELVRGLRAVAGGDALLAPSVTRRLIEEFVARSKEPRPAAEFAFLTDREREVTALVAEGLSNGEIAERLFVSAATVKTHVSRSMTKLQARDRAQLVVIAYESGLV